MKKRFTEEQLIGFLKQVQTGVAVKDMCCKHGFSDVTFYTWRRKFGGMKVADAKRLRELEAENAKLKKLLAESLLDILDFANHKLALKTGTGHHVQVYLCTYERVSEARAGLEATFYVVREPHPDTPGEAVAGWSLSSAQRPVPRFAISS